MVEEKSETEKSQLNFIENKVNVDMNSEDSLTKESLEDEWIDILGNGQLKKKVLKPGIKDSRPNRGDICKIKYVGKLEDGTVVDEEEEFSFQQGDVEVIQVIYLI